MYPSHGVKICNDAIERAAANNQDLLSIEKDFVLGSGVTFRFFFIEKETIPKRKVIRVYGNLKKPDDPIFQELRVTSILSMKFIWFTIGYFYVLSELDE